MKTAMQELIEYVQELYSKDDILEVIVNKANRLLEKEKEQIMKAVKDSYECTYNSCDSGCGGNIEIDFTPQEYYNETYNPKTPPCSGHAFETE